MVTSTQVAEVLRSSELWLKREFDIWADDPSDLYFDPDWLVKLDHEEVRKLIHNLHETAKFLDRMGGSHDA